MSILILGCRTCKRLQIIHYGNKVWDIEDDDKCHIEHTWGHLLD